MAESTKNIKKYGVHVKGPDSMLPAHSFQDANRHAYEINQAQGDEILVIATVIVWPDGWDHLPDSVDWFDIG